jgi:hypothetical protein
MSATSLRRTTASAIAALLASVVFACSGTEGKACYQGDYQSCACGDAGQTGYAQCNDQASYGACDCSGNYAFLPDSGVAPEAGDAAPEAPALHGITQSCMTDADCMPGLECFHFNARGPACTHACMVDSDCELPSPGCSGMKVCKSG